MLFFVVLRLQSAAGCFANRPRNLEERGLYLGSRLLLDLVALKGTERCLCWMLPGTDGRADAGCGILWGFAGLALHFDANDMRSQPDLQIQVYVLQVEFAMGIISLPGPLCLPQAQGTLISGHVKVPSGWPVVARHLCWSKIRKEEGVPQPDCTGHL